MPRLVRLTATTPFKIEPGAIPADKAIWICQCGLSQKMPFCDGSHKSIRDEPGGMVCLYAKDAPRVLRAIPDEHPPEAR